MAVIVSHWCFELTVLSAMIVMCFKHTVESFGSEKGNRNTVPQFTGNRGPYTSVSVPGFSLIEHNLLNDSGARLYSLSNIVFLNLISGFSLSNLFATSLRV